MDDVVHVHRYGSHVDRRRHGLAVESSHDAFGDVDGHADLRFHSRCAQMGRNDDVVQAFKGIDILSQRFFREDVDSRASYVAAPQGVCQGVDIQHSAARYVDHPHAVFHLGDFFRADHARRLLRQRRVHRNVVGRAQERIQVDRFDAELLKAVFGNVRVVADGLHFHGLHALGDARANAAEADDADGLVLELDARKPFPVPFAGHQGIVSLGDVAGHGHDHGAGVFRRSYRIGRRRIDDDNPSFCRRLDVDAVDADAGPADDLQFRGRVDDLFRYVGHGAGNQAVVLADALDKSRFV